MDLDSLTDEFVRCFEENIPAADSPILKEFMEISPENRAFVEERMSRERIREYALVLLDRDMDLKKAGRDRVIAALQSKALPVEEETKRVNSIWKKLVLAAVFIGLGWILLWLVFKPAKNMDEIIADKRNESPRIVDRSMIALGNADPIYLDRSWPKNGYAGNGLTVVEKDGILDFGFAPGDNRMPQAGIQVYLASRMSKRLVLPDGSQVWLNAGSRLTYFEGNGKKRDRYVYLQGEGFFDVHSDAKRPFVCATSQGKAVATGTRFNVIDRGKGGNMRVALLRGKLEVFPEKGVPLIMNIAQEAILNKDTILDVRQKIDTLQINAWRGPRFDFTRQTLPEVMEQLISWYGLSNVQFATDIDIQKRGMLGFGTVGKSPTIEGVLDDLFLGVNLKYRIKDGIVYVFQ